jgi:hypothetical protein
MFLVPEETSHGLFLLNIVFFKYYCFKAGELKNLQIVI